MTSLPKKITPDSITESIFEIRFTSNIPEGAIFGLFYSQFKDDYPEFDKLPILQMPEAIRNNEPNLKYSPHYRHKKDKFILQIGPNAISISNVEGYVGWDLFSKQIFDVFQKAKNAGVIDKIERIGLRYINILEGINIFEKSNILISLNDKNLTRKTQLITEINIDNTLCNLKVASDVVAQIGGNKSVNLIGSLIDIDILVSVTDINSFKASVEKAHDTEKKMFFDIINNEFLNTLKPEY